MGIFKFVAQDVVLIDHNKSKTLQLIHDVELNWEGERGTWNWKGDRWQWEKHGSEIYGKSCDLGLYNYAYEGITHGLGMGIWDKNEGWIWDYWHGFGEQNSSFYFPYGGAYLSFADKRPSGIGDHGEKLKVKQPKGWLLDIL